MRFMFVIPTLSQGGAERVVSVLSTALTEQGDKVAVVIYFSTDNEYKVGKKVEIINLSEGDINIYRKNGKIKLITNLRNAVKDFRPDCIIPFTYPVAQITEISTLGLHVEVFQSIRINPALGPAQRWKRYLRDRLVYKSKCTFVQNEQQKQYFRSSYRKNIHILFNPVQEELFSASQKLPGNEFIICSLGRLTDQKNYPLLINAFATAFEHESSVFLKIYGEGAKKEELQKLIDQYGLSSRIKLMGRTNDVKAVFQDTDLYVLSSNWEGMPNTLIEAMACHVPCLSTNCPTGPSDLIDNGVNGILVPPNDKQAMAAAMYDIYSMPYQKRVTMSEKGRQTVRNKCSSSQIAIQLKQICSSFIN